MNDINQETMQQSQQESEQKNEEKLREIKEQKKRDSAGKRNWFLGGMFAGLLVALLISTVTFLVGSARSGGMKPTLKNNVPAGTGASSEEESVLSDEVENKLQLLESSIKEYYLSGTTNEELELGLYKGIVEALNDPYSAYYTPEELAQLQESSSGIYYGIGAYVGIDPDTTYAKITSVIENTPAQEAGLQAEDVIVSVDGQSTKGLSTTDVVKLIKGEENTDVVLTIYRIGETDYLDITVTRRKVEAPTVNYEMLEGGIAYIQIMQFEQVSGSQFRESIAKAREEGMKGLILDLRNNPGGTLSSVVEIANQLLPEGLIVYTEDKNGEREEFRCSGEHELEVPLVVLVNENSASASEILAGAIKDHGTGTLLGTTTFGKGIVQKVFGITDGSAIKLTISHYYTPKGNDIHKVGIEPDETLELDVEQYLDGTDNQLQRAEEILAGEIKE